VSVGVCTDRVPHDEAVRLQGLEDAAKIHVVERQYVELQHTGPPCKPAFPVGCGPQPGKGDPQRQAAGALGFVQGFVAEEIGFDGSDSSHGCPQEKKTGRLLTGP
jgi:hypothetical protein